MTNSLKVDGPATVFVALQIATGPGESRADCLRRLRDTLPCGSTAPLYDWTAVPLVDMPCPCGDPNHWLVRWIDTPLQEAQSTTDVQQPN